MSKYIVYILRTNKNTLYTGQTNDLEKRLAKHRSGRGAKYMKCFESFELVYTEQFETLSEALKREYEIKQMTKANKEALIVKV